MPDHPANAIEGIPHRPPMLLLDEVVSRSADTIVCKKTFGADEFFLQGHYPGNPVVPGVILCECAAQAGAVLVAANLPGDDGQGLPVLTRLTQAKFKQLVRPGQTVNVEVHLDEQLADAFFFSGKLTCDDRNVATLSFACKLVVPSDV